MQTGAGGGIVQGDVRSSATPAALTSRVRPLPPLTLGIEHLHPGPLGVGCRMDGQWGRARSEGSSRGGARRTTESAAAPAAEACRPLRNPLAIGMPRSRDVFTTVCVRAPAHTAPVELRCRELAHLGRWRPGPVRAQPPKRRRRSESCCQPSWRVQRSARGRLFLFWLRAAVGRGEKEIWRKPESNNCNRSRRGARSLAPAALCRRQRPRREPAGSAGNAPPALSRPCPRWGAARATSPGQRACWLELSRPGKAAPTPP